MTSPSAIATLDRSGPPRVLVLCSAVLLGFAAWSASQVPVAGAQESKAPAAAAPAIPVPPTPPTPPAKPAESGKITKSVGPIGITIETDSKKDGAKADDTDDEDEAKDAKGKHRTIIVKKDGKTVKITGVPNDDDEIDSLGEIGKMNPALASMVVGIVAVVFFAPVIAIALIVWYRMRKTRMQNELALKLAERGIVPSSEALGAVGGGAAATPGPMAAVGDTLREARRRTTSSDLRKGVVMTAIGLAITVYTGSDGHPNIFGLVLLFVGIGYGVLWWFEQRPQQQAAARYANTYGNGSSMAPPPPPPPPVPGAGPGDRGGAA
jgi:hypothetical protein